MTYRGTLSRADFGPGAWILEQSDGGKVQLVGDVPTHLEGCRVTVTGQALEGGMGFAMVGGEMVQVSAIQKA
ncbi:MAG: hypothetical protein GWP91_01800 [Rhodobacterales bacterium]|nr:hypothetical protein [Rhodobacterales bacterium]